MRNSVYTSYTFLYFISPEPLEILILLILPIFLKVIYQKIFREAMFPQPLFVATRRSMVEGLPFLTASVTSGAAAARKIASDFSLAPIMGWVGFSAGKECGRGFYRSNAVAVYTLQPCLSSHRISAWTA